MSLLASASSVFETLFLFLSSAPFTASCWSFMPFFPLVPFILLIHLCFFYCSFYPFLPISDPWTPSSDDTAISIARRSFRDITLRVFPILQDKDKRPALRLAIQHLIPRSPQLQTTNLQLAIAALNKRKPTPNDAFGSLSANQITLCDVLCTVVERVQLMFTRDGSMPKEHRDELISNAFEAGLSLFGGELHYGDMVRFYQAVAHDLRAV